MKHAEVGRIRTRACASARRCLVVSLSVVSVAVLNLVALPASASTDSHNWSLQSSAISLESRAKTPGTWNSAIEVPGSAALNVGGNAGINSISCSSTGNCGAAGNYVDGLGNSQAFVVNEVNGTWGDAIEVPGTGALNGGGNATANSISCASDGNCSAGGSYTDGFETNGFNDVQGFVVSETGGTWGAASEVVGFTGLGSPNSFGVASVSCSAAGECSAVGLDTAIGGAPVGFALTQTNGTWGGASQFPMASTLGPGGTELNSVSCTSLGNCSAEGDAIYADQSVHGGVAFIPFVLSEVNSIWQNNELIPGLSTLNVGLVATADAISCSSPGNCSVGGDYTDDLANAQAFIVNETSGTWGTAVEVPGTSALNLSGAIVNSISCTSLGNCGASGLYTTAAQSEDFVVSETKGTWGYAIEIPGSSSLFIGGAAANANPISCSSAGNCSTGGSYLDTLGNFQAYVDTERDGAWGDVFELPGSSTLNTDGGGVVTTVSCSADSGCGVGGYYQTGSQTFQGLVSDMAPLYTPQATLTVTSLEGKVGVSLQLTTSGGSGRGLVSYFVMSGSAKGCSYSRGTLSVISPGTCVVTATKASDGTYAAVSSTPTAVSFAVAARPRTLTVEFNHNNAALTPAAKSSLIRLVRELVKGASVTVTGSAKGDAPLAKSRATVVANYLKSKAHATIRIVTTSGANSATIVTTKQ